MKINGNNPHTLGKVVVERSAAKVAWHVKFGGNILAVSTTKKQAQAEAAKYNQLLEAW